ncbi:LacI family DNA-binding transcriptional regulator [Microbacterium sp. LWH3-1.2]|uniref:LacI family DNA-binding transcriptional regulator n=1 Tax=Microbacterium sp. LWH3-1.2 TaxID=3135256 RepID=UPI0034441928
MADRARVSSTTASVVLGGRADEFRIAPETRDAVLEAARHLGYVRVPSSRRSRASTPPLWVILTPSDFESGPIRQFFEGASAFVRDNGLAVDCMVLPFERGRLSEKSQWITPEFARGAIMVGLTDEDVAFIDEHSFDIPIALYNRTARGCASVVVDDYGAGRTVMQHFLERGLRQFAVVAPPHASRALSLRTVGFSDTLRQSGGADSSAQVQQVFADVYDAAGFDAAIDAISIDERTGIFVLNDQMVARVMEGLTRRGLTVPDDVEVVSYGDSPINTVVRPAVSSVRVPVDEMSLECARTLQQSVTNRDAMIGVIRSFETTLVVRASSPATV